MIGLLQRVKWAKVSISGTPVAAIHRATTGAQAVHRCSLAELAHADVRSPATLVIGAVAAPSAVLIRPDGHVAWVGDGTDQGLRDALTTWFGPPTAP